MNRLSQTPEKPCPRTSNTAISPGWTKFVGLAGILASSIFGCQAIVGLQDLKLADEIDGGMGGSGGGISVTNASSSVSSSSGIPIMGDIACGAEICPVGIESACCSDHYKTNSDPYLECVTGPPSTDGCNTAGGANGYETRIECQLPSHCPQGTVCCGNLEVIAMTATWYTTLSCTATCAWPDTVVCDPMDTMNDCPVVNNEGTMVQTTCLTSPYLPTGYGVCRIPP